MAEWCDPCSLPEFGKRADLEDSWGRYLPCRVSETSETSETPLPSNVSAVSSVSDTRQACTECSEPLDQALIAAGLTDHGETEASQ